MSWELIIAFSSVVISLLSVGVAIWSAIKSNSIGKEQTELQRKVVELEEKREEEKKVFENSASIHAEIDFEETAGYRFPRSIMIWNQGMMNAENLRVYIDNEPSSEVNYLLTDKNEDVLEVLPAGDYYSYSFKTREENQPAIEVKVIFDDPQGSDQEYKRKLRV